MLAEKFISMPFANLVILNLFPNDAIIALSQWDGLANECCRLNRYGENPTRDKRTPLEYVKYLNHHEGVPQFHPPNPLLSFDLACCPCWQGFKEFLMNS